MKQQKKIKKIILVLSLIFILGFSAQVWAQQGLPNPLGQQEITKQSVLTFAGKVAKGAIAVSGSIALLLFIYGGFLWLTSQGEPAKIKKGRDGFLWSVVGLAIIFSSYFLVDFLIRGLTTGTPGPKCCVIQDPVYQCSQLTTTADIKDTSASCPRGVLVPGLCKDLSICPVE